MKRFELEKSEIDKISIKSLDFFSGEYFWKLSSFAIVSVFVFFSEIYLLFIKYFYY